MPPTPTSPMGRVRPAQDRAQIGRLWLCLVAFCVLGFALRLGLALAMPTIHRTDEVIQNLEPAHRLATGWGIVAWEWRDGIRSWLFPDLLAALMRLAGHLGSGQAAYMPLIAAALSAASLVVVITGTLLGWRRGGTAGAVLCGLLCSCWPDLVYFAPKTLEEVQAGNLLIVATGLAAVLPGSRRLASGCFIVGLVLGGVFCLRFQLAPALLLVAVWAARKRLAAGWLPLLVGVALPVALLGINDQIALGRPFQSIWLNLYVNMIMGRAATYGVSSPIWYALEEARWWGAALLPFVVFFCLGVRLAPLPASVAVLIVLTHSLIGHKEISFIYAAVPPALVVVGLGTTSAVLALPKLMQSRLAIRHGLTGAAALWAAVMALTGVAEANGPWRGVDYGLLPLVRTAARQPELCGLALYGADFPWNSTGGYTWLDRPVPIYLLHTPADLAQAQSAFDELLVRVGLGATLTGYQTVRCNGDYCLLRRPQACSPAPELEINQVLQRMPTQATIPLPAWVAPPRQ